MGIVNWDLSTVPCTIHVPYSTMKVIAQGSPEFMQTYGEQHFLCLSALHTAVVLSVPFNSSNAHTLPKEGTYTSGPASSMF